jgi:hypothetical protein
MVPSRRIKRVQVDRWIKEIEEGQTPDFRDWSQMEFTLSSFIRTIRAQWRSRAGKRFRTSQT